MTTEITAMQNVVILGMHRSGTSALTGALCQMGWNCGPADNVLAADWANEKGYFERKDVVDANERLLVDATASSSLSGLGTDERYASLEDGAWALGALALSRDGYLPPRPIDDAIRAVARNLLDGAIPGRPWVLKDPRLCLTLPYWAKHLEIGRLILIVRRPEEVALSLNRLNGLPLEFNKLAWAAYVSGMLRHRDIAPSIVVLHSELIEGPSATMKRISSHLADLPDGIPDRLGAAFIDSGLVHHVASPGPPGDTPHDQAYACIAQGDLGSAEAHLKAIMESASTSDWLVVRLLLRNLKLESDIDAMRERLKRINQHPVTGPILGLTRWLKGDPTFGAGER
jgi:hypothetical protein